MTRDALNAIRLFAPVSIVAGCWAVLYGLTGGEFTSPNVTDLKNSVFAVAVGAAYYISPLRNISNKLYFERVKNNLFDAIIRISKLEEQRHLIDYKRAREIFFDIVNHDETLLYKSALIRNNGAYWTSVADFRAITLIFMIFSIGLAVGGVTGATLASIAYAIGAALSIYLSEQATLRHISLMEEQQIVLDQKYASKLRDRILREL